MRWSTSGRTGEREGGRDGQISKQQRKSGRQLRLIMKIQGGLFSRFALHLALSQ